MPIVQRDGAGQKRNRIENCISRQVPVPTGEDVYALVMAPKVVPDFGSVHFRFGLPICARLNTLNMSARKLRPVRSVNRNRFSMARSACQMPGTRTAFLGAFPHCPLAGVANAKGLSQRPGVWFAGYKVW